MGGVRALQLWEESERYSNSCGRSQSVTVTAVGGVRALQLELWEESERYSNSCGRSQSVTVTAVGGVRALQ